MDDHTFHVVCTRHHSRSQIVRSNHIEGQGMSSKGLCSSQTERCQIVYDLDQVPRASLTPLRDSIISLLQTYAHGPKPLRTQLCVCLVNLAIQMIEWKNVLQLVASSLGSGASDAILEFLQVLPEEVTEGRKINLSVCRIESQFIFGQSCGPRSSKTISI
jgi:hypothetical protein